MPAVRIADDLRKATVFLGEDVTDQEGEPTIDPPQGTGFFVTWASDAANYLPGADREHQAIYLVTARHVAEALSSNFLIRFNTRDQGAEIDVVNNAQWYYHHEHTVDVAILHCGYPDWADCVPLPGRLFVRPDEYADPGAIVPGISDIGIGDISYVVGLFNRFYGKQRNLPVVHTGHIALLPGDELIPVWNRRSCIRQEVEGYLVQAHGLEGLSGAPVFARTSLPIYANYRLERDSMGRSGLQAGRMHGLTAFLGLWQSSWEDAFRYTGGSASDSERGESADGLRSCCSGI
jgi:hypothetical protein